MEPIFFSLDIVNCTSGGSKKKKKDAILIFSFPDKIIYFQQIHLPTVPSLY